MKSLALFLVPGTRRRSVAAARAGLWPDEPNERPGDLETGRGADFETRRIRRSGLRQRNVVTTFGLRSLRERNVVTTFGLRSLRQRNVAATFGLRSLRERNVAATFGLRSLRERNVVTTFGLRSLRQRNVATTFGLGSLRERNVGAFWHFRGCLAPNGMRGGCRGS